MTLDEFRKSGRSVDDLRTVDEPSVADAYEVKTPGRIYAGNLVIEESFGAAGGNWCLTIGNASRLSDDLADLERELFEYGLTEDADLFPPTGKTEQALIDELRDYCAAQRIPHEAADDLLACHPLTRSQRDWLTKFCARWHEAVGR